MGNIETGVGTIAAWTNAGFLYGTLDGTKDVRRCASYTGGTSFSEVFGGSETRSMREILCRGLEADKSSGAWHIIAAMLNANYFKGSYILSSNQVKGLWDKTIQLPPPYTDLKSFLDTTWI